MYEGWDNTMDWPTELWTMGDENQLNWVKAEHTIHSFFLPTETRPLGRTLTFNKAITPTPIQGRAWMYGGWDNTMDWPTELWTMGGENKLNWAKAEQAGDLPGEIRGSVSVGWTNGFLMLGGCAHDGPEVYCTYTNDIWLATVDDGPSP